MRIYQNKQTDSILTINLNTKKVSTRSSYHDSFFKSISDGNYGYFDYTMAGVKNANEEKVTFYETEGCEFSGASGSPEETFVFIGEAENYEELKSILQ